MIRGNTIYKRDSLGNIRVWFYEVDGPRWRSNAGILDGALVTSGWTVCEPKSQPTAEAQALFEAEAEMRKKLEREYHASVDDIDTPNFFKPMLAKAYEGWAKIDGKVYTQPKLDGIRCIATAAGLFSRQGRRIYGVPHIEEALAPFFEADPSLIFDGELYNHDLRDDFNKITSIVRKQNPTEDQLQQSRELIQYHIYDLPSAAEKPFDQRFSMLCNLDPIIWERPSLNVVPTNWAVNEHDLNEYYVQYTSDGYEGQMIRLNVAYEQKRSKALLKRKDFLDAEFKIVRIEEGVGNWAGYAKKVTLALPDGREFGAGIKGSQSFTQQLLQDRDQYVGKLATIRYFELTPDGIPRFPVAVDFGRVD